MWGAIASAIGGIASLFGGGDQETTTTSYVDYKRMVRMAEAAGFNPLTAIRNGGSAGFTVGTTTQSGAPLSSRIANAAGAIGTGIDSFMENFDPIKDQKRELEYRLVERQLANLNAGARPPGLGGVPAYTAGAVQPRKLGSGSAHGAPIKPLESAVPQKAAPSGVQSAAVVDNRGASQTPDIEKPTVTNPYPKSWGIQVDPDVPDAEAWETRNGDSELNSMIAGAVVTSSDLLYTGKKKGWFNPPPPAYPSTGAEAAQQQQYTAALSKKQKEAAKAEAAARRAGYVPYPSGLYPYMGPRL